MEDHAPYVNASYDQEAKCLSLTLKAAGDVGAAGLARQGSQQGGLNRQQSQGGLNRQQSQGAAGGAARQGGNGGRGATL